MCPDDCDFYCICIVAEIHNSGQTVTWLKIGSDRSDLRDANNVGTTVDWYSNFQKLEFTIKYYLKVLADFKDRYALDKVDYLNRSKKFAE